MDFHFKHCSLLKSIFSLQRAFLVSVQIFRFMLYFGYMPITKAVYNVLISTKVLNFNLFSIHHFLYFILTSFLWGNYSVVRKRIFAQLINQLCLFVFTKLRCSAIILSTLMRHLIFSLRMYFNIILPPRLRCFRFSFFGTLG